MQECMQCVKCVCVYLYTHICHTYTHIYVTHCIHSYVSVIPTYMSSFLHVCPTCVRHTLHCTHTKRNVSHDSFLHVCVYMSHIAVCMSHIFMSHIHVGMCDMTPSYMYGCICDTLHSFLHVYHSYIQAFIATRMPCGCMSHTALTQNGMCHMTHSYMYTCICHTLHSNKTESVTKEFLPRDTPLSNTPYNAMSHASQQHTNASSNKQMPHNMHQGETQIKKDTWIKGTYKWIKQN